MLTWLILTPFIGGLACLALRGSHQRTRLVALATACIELALALSCTLVTGGPDFFLWTDVAWIPSLGIRYQLGMDGISLVLVILSAFLGVVSILGSWRAITDRVALFHFFLLFLEAGIMGVFLALDLFLFYLFWEIMLIPMFFLIAIWGHGRRLYSAVKFFLFTIVGGLVMLIGIISLAVFHDLSGGDFTFSYLSLLQTPLSESVQFWLFWSFAIAFLIKVPVIPLHTWLPDAHTEAPTAGSVLLAGLLLKTGTYGLVRFAYPLFPSAAEGATTLLVTLALLGIFYGAWVALAQRDIKRLVAYSSISHLGFVVLGIAAWNMEGVTGAVLQMVNHGLTTGALFLMVGMLDEREGSRAMYRYGGLWERVPILSGLFLFFALASLGLPGLNNFVGEFLILLGAYRISALWAAAAFFGVVAAAIYMLWLVQKVLWGPPGPAMRRMAGEDVDVSDDAKELPLGRAKLSLPAPLQDWIQPRKARLPGFVEPPEEHHARHPWTDATRRELWVLVPLVVAVVWLGVYPKPVIDVIEPSVEATIQHQTEERPRPMPTIAERTDGKPVIATSEEPNS